MGNPEAAAEEAPDPNDEYTALKTKSHEQRLAGRPPWAVRSTEGDASAAMALAVHFYDRNDRPDARRWFEQAAALGDTNGCFSLGVMCYEDGDTDRARRLFRRAADGGHVAAMVNYGVMLLSA